MSTRTLAWESDGGEGVVLGQNMDINPRLRGESWASGDKVRDLTDRQPPLCLGTGPDSLPQTLEFIENDSLSSTWGLTHTPGALMGVRVILGV